ncbi:neprilysin-4-like [Drosophila bipectinata]|uniref:neprilysin-4-like n=1 Tax=Drosophila bipectinata TaxID=42026 RepID=UPI001C895F21|nr:neprilysin-1-like [Drosophila bipectinata]
MFLNLGGHRISMLCVFGYILVGSYILECKGKSVGDSSNSENVIKDDTVEYLKSYGEKMRSYMNLSVAPCDDFYEYACGNWKNVRPDRFQPNHKRNNLLDIIYTLINEGEKLLTSTQLAQALNVSSELLVAQQFYNTCLSAVVFPFPAADPAYLKLIRSLGGFPAVDGAAWNASSFSWFNMSAHLTNFGVNGLINEDILPQYPFGPYFKLPELGFDHIVQTDNIANSTSRAYKLNEKRMKSYLQPYNLTEDKISEVIAGVFDFWRDALAVADRFEGDNEKCIEISANEDLPKFHQWESYYEIAWNGKNFSNVGGTDGYCDYYYELLEKVCSKHPEAVANYLAMLLLYRMDAKLKEEKYHKDYCLSMVQFSFSHLLNKLYMAEHFIERTRSEVSAIVGEVRKSQRKALEKVEWLDPETRREAQLKESTIESVIGSYENEEVNTRLIQEIRGLDLKNASYFQNLIHLRKLVTRLRRFNGFHYEELHNESKPLELLLGMQVNAFYYNLDNSIYVMAGILHPPAYHPDWPNSLKFGTLGYLVGHELTHGFDTIGSTFNSEGEMRNWWSKKSRAVFEERATCFVDHYGRYLIPEINQKINGKETQDENIADSGGLQGALDAYRNHMKQLKNRSDEDNEILKSEKMPGLDLSPEQLFYLGFAQLWCSDYEQEHFWEELKMEHTIDKYRVLGAVSNNHDFSKVYNCPVGSLMHPKADACHIW